MLYSILSQWHIRSVSALYWKDNTGCTVSSPVVEKKSFSRHRSNHATSKSNAFSLPFTLSIWSVDSYCNKQSWFGEFVVVRLTLLQGHIHCFESLVRHWLIIITIQATSILPNDRFYTAKANQFQYRWLLLFQSLMTRTMYSYQINIGDCWFGLLYICYISNSLIYCHIKPKNSNPL